MTATASDYRRDLFRPRPVRRATDLGRLLLALEPSCVLADPFVCLPERARLLDEDEACAHAQAMADGPRSRQAACLPPAYRLLLAVFGAYDQPASEPCRHCEDAGHGVSLDDWAALTALYDPEGASGPPLDPEGGVPLLTHEARVACYARRAYDGWACRHPEDVLAIDRVGATGVAGRHDVRGLDGGLVAAGEDREPVAEAWAAGREVGVDDLHALVLAELAARRWRHD